MQFVNLQHMLKLTPLYIYQGTDSTIYKFKMALQLRGVYF